MTNQNSPDLVGRLTRAFREMDPGTAPVGLGIAIDRIPDTVERIGRRGRGRWLVPAFGLAAAGAAFALLAITLPHSSVGPASGAEPTAAATAFDPTRTGIGIESPFSPAVPWLVVILACVGLAAPVIRMGRRRLAGLPIAAGIGLLAYAAYGTFAPIDVHVTGYGAGLNVRDVDVPTGAPSLWHIVAEPGQPFSVAILLIGGTNPPVTIDGLAQEPPANGDFSGRWSALWIDAESHGGVTGPDRPFAAFAMPESGQAIWLVGRASMCALGAAQPSTDQAGGYMGPLTAQLNVSVYGWPRTVDLELPRIVEPTGTCHISAAPSP